jgi:hypothetical protein
LSTVHLSELVIILKYKLRIFFYFIIWKIGGSLIITYKFKHALYRHFPETWRLWRGLYAQSLFYDQVDTIFCKNGLKLVTINVCLMVILWSVFCHLSLNHLLELLIEGHSGHFIILDCHLYHFKMMDLLRSLCLALCCTFKYYWH